MIFSSELAAQTRQIWELQSAESKKRLWKIAFFTLFVGIIELAVAGMVSLFGTALAAPQSILSLGPVVKIAESLPALAAYLQHPAVLLAAIMTGVAAGICMKNLMLGILTYKQNIFSYSVAAEFGTLLFDGFINKPYTWHMQQNASELSSIMGFRTYVGSFLASFFTLVSQAVIALCLLVGGLVLAPFATLVVIGITGTIAAGVYSFSKKRLRRRNERLAQVSINLGKDTLAAFHGIKEVKIYAREQATERNITTQLNSIIKDTAYSAVYPSLPPWALESAGICSLLAALFCLIWWEAPLEQITGTLTLLAAMAWRLLPCMNKTVSSIVCMQGFVPYLTRFFDALESAEKEPVAKTDSCNTKNSFSHEIVLSNISFRYAGAEQAALSQFSMRIPRGASVGIVGPSGAGKSTLVNILTGLLQPDSGEITMDGILLTDSRQKTLPRMGYVPQSFYMLDASLAKNVAFSAFGEALDEQKVLWACKQAALDFWQQLSEGIYTELGERGVRISGGQAQRVAIARALYAEPELLIFDEATSALDGASEAAILKTIENLRNRMTVVMIAHRLSTVADCDIVYWVEKGTVVQAGSPEQVLPAYEATMAIEHALEDATHDAL